MSYNATEKHQIDKILAKQSWLKKEIEEGLELTTVKVRTGFRINDGVFDPKDYWHTRGANNPPMYSCATTWLNDQTIIFGTSYRSLRKVFLDKNGIELFDTRVEKGLKKKHFWNICHFPERFDRRSTIGILRSLKEEGKEPYFLLIHELLFEENKQRFFLYITPEKDGFISLSEYAEHVIWKESKIESEKLEKALNGDTENAPELQSLKQSLRDLAERIDTGDATLYQAREELKKLYEPPTVKETKKAYHYNDCCGGH
jgi:hypothetical protein